MMMIIITESEKLKTFTNYYCSVSIGVGDVTYRVPKQITTGDMSPCCPRRFRRLWL